MQKTDMLIASPQVSNDTLAKAKPATPHSSDSKPISLAPLGQSHKNFGLPVQGHTNRAREAGLVKFCLNFNNPVLQRIHVFLPHLYRIPLEWQDNKKNKQLAAFVNAKTHSRPTGFQQN